jgi:hypothetical protein
MSILNLNTPQGRGPAGKKSVKLWMGVGLLAAVLGFGSTLAASISINNNNLSEFGQGVAQTVYCGKDNPTKITVKPMSSFVNSTVVEAIPEVPATWTQPVFEGIQFKDVSSSQTSKSYLSSYVSDATGISSTIRGYWVKSRTSDSYYEGSNAPPTGDYRTFVPQVGPFGGKYGFYEYDRWTPGEFSGFQAGVPASTTPSKFELSGVEISNIPASCSGKNFVISAYGETGTAKTFIADGPSGPQVKEITAFWDGLSNGVVRVSGDRNSFDSNEMIAGEQTASKLTIDLVLEPSRIRLNSQEVYKLVVETQEDALNVS